MPASTSRAAYIAPSIDLSVAFHRARPDEPWLYAQATAPSASGGLIGAKAAVWSRDGTLLAVGAEPTPLPPRPHAAMRIVKHIPCGSQTHVIVGHS